MTISTHILDTAQGHPAAGISVLLEYHSEHWQPVGRGITDAAGRIPHLLNAGEPSRAGLYRLIFQTGGTFFPEVIVQFHAEDANAHYHVPLLLSPYGYTTYRGS